VTRRLVALLLVGVAACAGRGASHGVPAGDGPLVGSYKAELSGGARSRHARVLLWSASPDRLHLEILGPVGDVRFSLDAGAGKACLVDARAGTAYVGDAGPAALEAIVGVRVSIEQAVAALAGGPAPEGIRMEREDGDAAGLPRRLALAAEGRQVILTLSGLQRGAASRPLGTGEAPPGSAVEPLDRWPYQAVAGDEPPGAPR
jgi:hypothetical protein